METNLVVFSKAKHMLIYDSIILLTSGHILNSNEYLCAQFVQDAHSIIIHNNEK